MKRKKVVVGLIAGLVLVVVLVMVVFYSSLDYLVKTAIVKVGSEVTQTQVSLAKVKLSPISGKAIFEGFSVANPRGFTSHHAVQFANITMLVDPSTLYKKVIIIRDITINEPIVTYELSQQGSNLAQLQKNITAYLAQHDTTTAGSQHTRVKTEKSTGPRFIIDNLYLKQGSINLVASLLGKSEKKSINLPDIHLQDLGKDSQGINAGQLAKQLLNIINQQVVTSSADFRRDALVDQLKDSANKVIKDLFN
jgi:uncharacterized protein involved in outer membrane biogenesis